MWLRAFTLGKAIETFDIFWPLKSLTPEKGVQTWPMQEMALHTCKLVWDSKGSVERVREGEAALR